MAFVGQIYDDEDEELNNISEAASRTNETYDILQTEDCDPLIILPAHIRLINFNVVIPIFNLIDFFSYLIFRCASHTLNLIASADTSLTNYDIRSLPKINALRKAMSTTAL
jgi:hypothetical protein